MIGEFHRLAEFLAAEGVVGSSSEYRADPAAQTAFLRRAWPLSSRKRAG